MYLYKDNHWLQLDFFFFFLNTNNLQSNNLKKKKNENQLWILRIFPGLEKIV